MCIRDRISRAVFYAYPEKELTEEEKIQYEECIKRRAERIPLQHITGVQEFMGLPFLVNEHVLIPRQDTEVLVEQALCLLEKEKKHKEIVRILDLCTGSGCILLSKPGMWVQNMTTKEPDDSIIEVAICAVEKVFDWREWQEKNNEL